MCSFLISFLYLDLSPTVRGAFATLQITHHSSCNPLLVLSCPSLGRVWLPVCLFQVSSWGEQWAPIISSSFNGWELPYLSLPFMWHSPHPSWCPPLYLLQWQCLSHSGEPELDAVLQVWSHWEGAEMKDHCPGCWEAYINKTNDPLTKSSHIIPTDPAVQNILVLALLPSVHSCFSIP